jgi:hypothetical protein
MSINKEVESSTSEERTKVLASRLDCLTEEELAQLAEVEPESVTNWRNRGIAPPYVKIGRKILYPISGLKQFIEHRMKSKITSEIDLGGDVL